MGVVLVLLRSMYFRFIKRRDERIASGPRKAYELAALHPADPVPRPSGQKYTAFELQPQATDRVVARFIDHDKVSHEVGERWKFLHKAFLPYEDGLSLFIEQDGRKSQIRLQCRAGEQGEIVNTFSDFVVEE